MNIEIRYDIRTSQKTISTIDESNIGAEDRLVKLDYDTLPISDIDQNDIQNVLSGLNQGYSTETTFKCWKPLTRINTYLLAIQKNLSSLNEYLSNDVYSRDRIQLNSTIEDFFPKAGIFGLTDFNSSCEQTFQMLTSFLDYALNTSGSKEGTVVSKIINVEDGYIPVDLTKPSIKNLFESIFMGQNFYLKLTQDADNTSFFVKTECKKYDAGKSTLIQLYELKMILNMFILKLKNIKKIAVRISTQQTHVQTSINVYGKNVVYNSSIQGKTTTGRNVCVTIGPYTITSIAENSRLNYLLNDQHFTNKAYLSSSGHMVINLDGLVYDVSSGASCQNIIPKNVNGTNGIFSYELTTTKTDKFDLTLEQIVKMFNLYKGEIINRKTILYAIDYIFNYWIEHTSTIEYIVTICHNNCHENTAKSTYTVTEYNETVYPITARVALHYTGQCGCGRLLTGTFDFSVSVPPEGTFVPEVSKIHATCNIGGYAMNTSPESLKISGSSFGERNIFRSFIGGRYHPDEDTGIVVSDGNTRYTVNAVLPTAGKEKDKYFCLELVFTTYYVVQSKRVEES